MIASISGKVIQLTKEAVVIDINGLESRFLSPPMLAEIETGDSASISTPTCSSGKITSRLYGFSSLEEKDFFLQFLSVGGIGPKLSLSILSSLSIDNIRSAILSEKPDYFSRCQASVRKLHKNYHSDAGQIARKRRLGNPRDHR